MLSLLHLAPSLGSSAELATYLAPSLGSSAELASYLAPSSGSSAEFATLAPTLWHSTCALCARPVTRGGLIAHRYTYAPPRCRTSQYLRTFIPLSVSLWNDLVDPVFDGVGLAGFKSTSNDVLLA